MEEDKSDRKVKLLGPNKTQEQKNVEQDHQSLKFCTIHQSSKQIL